jgi:protein-L-isoaspartate(D-aspartate) O-methyltransferase
MEVDPTMIRQRLAALALGCFATAATHADTDYDALRQAMVQEIASDVAETSSYTGIESLDAAVVDAMRKVPRHEFVPPEIRARAYMNRPQPIGEQQTISQPFIVALMTHLAGIGPQSRVLEIGTGSGYQAAVLAEITDNVFTIEIIDILAERAAATLATQGYDTVEVKAGDGYQGWPEHAPFDAILVTAAPDSVPQPLIEQLAVGGKMVIPVGPEGETQSLQVLEKRADGGVTRRDVIPVIFVPFTRE